MANGENRMTTKQKWVLALVSIGSFMVALDVLVVATALSTIRLDLGASLASLEWIVGAYNLTFAVLLMTGAALGDRFGRRRVFLAGLSLFTVASAACALAPNIGWLITARAIQGVGSAMVLPLALTLLSATFSAETRGKALGVFAGVTGLATFSGPFIGGAVAEGIAWQWIFWINIPIGLVLIALVMSRIEESYGKRGSIDVGGILLVTGTTLGLVWGLVRGNTAGWGSVEVVSTLVVGVLLGVGFVLWEGRVDDPMLPMRFFRLRAFSTANVANFCLYASLFGALFLLAQYLQTALGYSPLGAGLRLMPWTATLMVCAPIAGKLTDRLGERGFMVGGLLLQTIGMAWLALIAAPDLPYSHMVVPLVISGCGVSMAMPAAQKAVVGAVLPQEIGKASGAVTMLRILGGVFGIAIASAVFAGAGSFASAKEFTDGYAPGIGVIALISLLGALAGLGIPARRKPLAATPAAAAPSLRTESNSLTTRQ
jgi:EmrB/QacA subfamily drug resistance transporter